MQECKTNRFDPWVRKIPWIRAWQPIPIFLPGKSHGLRRVRHDLSDVACTHDRPDQIKGCLTRSIREGNGTPLQYSCLENPMDGGAWWAAVHGVIKSQTQLSNLTFTFHFHALEKAMATPVFLPGESQGQGSLVGCHLWGHTESDMTEVT